MHSIARREGDEASMLVERNAARRVINAAATFERRNVMAFGRECLQSMVAGIDNDDSTLVVDTHTLGMPKVTRLRAVRAKLEQERAIDGRQYLHSIVVAISDDDSISIVIERHGGWVAEGSRAAAVRADDEQRRVVLQRQHMQLEPLGDDETPTASIDRESLRPIELECWATIAKVIALPGDVLDERIILQ